MRSAGYHEVKIMDNMIWITFFLTLLSGAITALIGVYIQQQYSQKKIRRRLVKALENELLINLRRIEENVRYLEHLPTDVDERKQTLVIPYATQAYGMLLTGDPELFFELNKQTSNKLMEVYEAMVSINSRYPAMAFGVVNYPDVQEAIKVLTRLKVLIVVVSETLRQLKMKGKI